MPPPRQQEEEKVVRIILSQAAQRIVKNSPNIRTVTALENLINSNEERYLYETKSRYSLPEGGEEETEEIYIIAGDTALVLLKETRYPEAAKYFARGIRPLRRVPKEIRRAAALQVMKEKIQIVEPPSPREVERQRREEMQRENIRLTELLKQLKRENERLREEGKPTVPLDPYAILGIPSNASVQEIKDAYRRLVLIYHPDQSRNPKTAEMFQRIEDAYKAALLRAGAKVMENPPPEPPPPPRPRKPLFLTPLAPEHIRYLKRRHPLILSRNISYLPWYSPIENGEDPHPREVQIYCPHDNGWYWMPTTAIHCKECGTLLPSTPQCPQCKSRLIPDRGLYCKQCGTQLPPNLAAPQENAYVLFAPYFEKLTETQTSLIREACARLNHGRDKTLCTSQSHGTKFMTVYLKIRDPRNASTLTQLKELQDAFDATEKETSITAGAIITEEDGMKLVREIMNIEKPAPEPENQTQSPSTQPSSTPPKTTQENIRDATKTAEQIAQQIIDAHRKLADRLDKFIGRPTGLVYVTCPNCGTTRRMSPQERFCDKCRTRLW